MLHVCVRTFDVTGIVENFLGTKQSHVSVFESARMFIFLDLFLSDIKRCYSLSGKRRASQYSEMFMVPSLIFIFVISIFRS